MSDVHSARKLLAAIGIHHQLRLKANGFLFIFAQPGMLLTVPLLKQASSNTCDLFIESSLARPFFTRKLCHNRSVALFASVARLNCCYIFIDRSERFTHMSLSFLITNQTTPRTHKHDPQNTWVM